MVESVPDKTQWGLLPTDVASVLRRRYWSKSSIRKQLLKGEIEFPLKVALKSPRGNKVLEDLSHFQSFVASWRAFEKQPDSRSGMIVWESRSFRSLLEQAVPVELHIVNVVELVTLIGHDAVDELRYWQNQLSAAYSAIMNRMGCVEALDEKALFNTLIEHLDTLCALGDDQLSWLCELLPQLKKGMGHGCYLRGLPVSGVDTKFMESHWSLIESIVSVMVDADCQMNGLMQWLDCTEKPKDWLLVRPLCDDSRCALGRLPLLRLSTDVLMQQPLPADTILVVENEQSCLALPTLPNTIVVAGGGKNVAWMSADWLQGKRVGYWGDIDSEGFSILSDVRSKVSHVRPLMMDRETVDAFQARMVAEPDSVQSEPAGLTDTERALFRELRANQFKDARLEQERLPLDYVQSVLCDWLRC